MADEEERLKAEKLAAAKKRVAQLQKQKKKANKKGGAATDAPKESAESAKDIDTSSKEIEQSSTPTPTPADDNENETTTPATTLETDNKEEETQEEPAPAPLPLASQEDDTVESTDKTDESPIEPMPDAPTSLSPGTAAPEADTGGNGAQLGTRTTHGRQPSLSIQSKMRSSSFRKTSVSQGSVSPSPSTLLKSPSLPPLTAGGDAVQEVYRKQSTRIEDLERENKRLEKEFEDASGRWRKAEDQLEDLREAGVDVVELKEKLEKAEEKVADIDALKAEIASLQRQNSHLQTRSSRNNASASAPGQSESPPTDLVQQLESKSATIEAMELEISNLRAQLSSNSSQETQIAALEDRLSTTQSALDKAQQELSDTKAALTRASEKAVREGVDKTSTETLIKTLQREIEDLKHEKTDAEKKIDTLEKKLQALGNLHKESESRHQTRLRESEKTEKEVAVLRTRLATLENDNLRLKEEGDRLRKRDTTGVDDNEGLDELEDEERSRLERRIRDLEGENFDLRRGVWKEKRQELATGDEQHEGYTSPDHTNPAGNANAFDDVDLVGGTPDHSRRRSMAQLQHQQQQHSSFSTVLQSGFAAFTGAGTSPNRSRSSSANNHQQHHHHQHHQPGTRGSLELLSEENLDDEFDEDAFARAQYEEEARKRVEWVRDIKGKLKEWKGWRLDLVDSRAGAEGAGVGMGEIFDV